MPRPQKQTVDYFSHDCKYGDTIPILEGLYGKDGYTFWWKLLETLGASEGHFLDCNKPELLRKLQARTHLSQNKCLEILNLLAEIEAIDSELWQQKVVWCQKFVDRLEKVYKKRKVEIPTRPDFRDQKPLSSGIDAPLRSDNPQSKVKKSKIKKSKEIPVGEDKSSNPYHSRFMGAWVAGFERYWGREAGKGLRGKAGAQFKNAFYPEFQSFATKNPDRVCKLIERIWTSDDLQTSLERKCCKEGRTVGALTYLARSVLQKERASEQVEERERTARERSRAEMRRQDEEAEAAKREADRLAEQRITDPVEWAKCVLVGQDMTEEGLQKLLKSKFILGLHREAVQILLEELTKQQTSKEA